jgi:hypothetical protein
MFSVGCPARKCKPHLSSLEQLRQATHFWTCSKTGCYPNWIPIWRLHSTTGQSSPHFHTNARLLLNRVLPQRWIRLETTFSLGQPVRRTLHHAIYFFGGLLKTVFMCHHRPRPSRNFVIGKCMHCRPLQRTGYTKSGMSLITVCICDPRCIYWRIVINTWETGRVPAAGSICCVRVGWEIHFLLIFETEPFFCVCPCM